MNGYMIYRKALARLGNENADEISLDNVQFTHVLELINQIASDLKVNTINELSSEVENSNDVIEAICCGTAMMLALNQGDIAKNQIFTNIYNAKRAAVLSSTSHIEDTLPIAESGV